jgi:hypothetical protein
MVIIPAESLPALQGRISSHQVGRAIERFDMDTSRFPWWLQSQIAELETQLGRDMTQKDLGLLDINEAAQTVTVADNSLLCEIRSQEETRLRGMDLPPNP